MSEKNIPDPSLLPNRIMDVIPRLSRTLIIHEANSHALVRFPVIPSREEWFPQALEKGHFSLANDLLTANGLTRMDNSPQEVDTGASYRQSKREMKWMVGAWVVFFVWVNGYGWLNAYLPEDEQLVSTVIGMPRWVFFGWLVPLMACNLFTLWFCLRFMQDEPMEVMPEEVPSEEKS